MKKSFFLVITLLLLTSLVFSQTMPLIATECGFPSIKQLYDLNCLGGRPDVIIKGTIKSYQRLFLFQQNIMRHIREESSDYNDYRGSVLVNEVIYIDNISDPDNPKNNQIIKIMLDKSHYWGYNENRLELFNLNKPKYINYLNKGETYIFFLIYATEYRGVKFELYSSREPAKQPPCENFYVYPIRIDGDQVEVPVQYYGSDKIIKKTFKYKEIINLYRN